MAEETSSRDRFSLPTYKLGEEGKPSHFNAATSREDAAEEAKALEVGDAAFIKRSDLKWTYAVITEKLAGEGESTVLRFEVDKDHNRKSFPEAQWGKYIRVIHVDDAELAKLKEEAGAVEKKEEETAKPAEEEAAPEAPKEEAAKEEPSVAGSTGGKSSASNTSKGSKSGWLSGLFSKKSAEEGKPASVPEEKEAEKPAEDSTATPAPTPVEESKEEVSVEAPLGETPSVELMKEGPAAAVLAADSIPKEEPSAAPESETVDDTKENSDPIKLTQPPTFLPSPKVAKEASKEDSRSPLNLKPVGLKKKNSLVGKIFGKKDKTPPRPTDKKVIIAPSPKSAAANAAALGADAAFKGKESKKEWFDPEACEVDYDKNPTDLFQALEARQFSYAEEMCKQVHIQFSKECRTWVVARGQKKKDSNQLRFRALPLHAALVFGAPDDMVKKILNAYPQATRGRDVKGRLPIHLALEHNASEEVVSAVIEAFPKGMFAKDKKDMLPLDYVNANMSRVHLKKYLPLVVQAKVEEERAKWEEELQAELEKQKIALKTDPVYMEDVINTVTDDVETSYATKMELLESNYQKEIQLLKKKHDSETQALLEGFEVKLNFERKLQKLKTKA